jgi:hypothetical protein
MATVSGMKDIKNTTVTKGPDGRWLTSGTVIFFVKLDGQQDATTIEVPFKNAPSEDDAHNQALKVLLATASAFGQIPPR